MCRYSTAWGLRAASLDGNGLPLTLQRAVAFYSTTTAREPHLSSDGCQRFRRH